LPIPSQQIKMHLNVRCKLGLAVNMLNITFMFNIFFE